MKYSVSERLCYTLIIFISVKWAKADMNLTESQEQLPNVFRNQNDLVDHLRNEGYVMNQKVVDVMKSVDRKYFITDFPYADNPLLIDNFVESPPYTVGFGLQYLKDFLQEGNRVLDIGYGSGYSTAVLAMMVGKTGVAVGTEEKPKRPVRARKRFMSDPFLRSQNLTVFYLYSKDLTLGAPEYGPYDAIHITPGIMYLPPDLVNQLKPGGRILVPISACGEIEYMSIFDKGLDGEVKFLKKEGHDLFVRRTIGNESDFIITDRKIKSTPIYTTSTTENTYDQRYDYG